MRIRYLEDRYYSYGDELVLHALSDSVVTAPSLAHRIFLCTYDALKTMLLYRTIVSIASSEHTRSDTDDASRAGSLPLVG